MQQGTAISDKDNICKQNDTDSTDILGILDKHSNDKSGLISILQDIQDEYGYLPEKALRMNLIQILSKILRSCSFLRYERYSFKRGN